MIGLFNEAINLSMQPVGGPVHLNVPLREPLYRLREYHNEGAPKVIESTAVDYALSEETKARIQQDWQSAQKKLIIAGAGLPDQELDQLLTQVTQDPSCVLLCESTSNRQGEDFISNIDLIAEYISHGMSEEEWQDFMPDMIVSFGGALVSKKLKFLLRRSKTAKHVHLSLNNEHWDTFQSLTEIINTTPLHYFRAVSPNQNEDNDYRRHWLGLYNKLNSQIEDYLNDLAFSDLQVFMIMREHLPEKLNIHYANSTPVRYSNLVPPLKDKQHRINANRGTSGIDGVVSTASGAAYTNEELTLCVTGDLAFFYDSNALWNKHLPANLRILILNNGGGNIFRIIPGPDSLEEMDQWFETGHHLRAQHLAAMYDIPYFFSEDETSLREQLPAFFDTSSNKPAILEVKTPNRDSAALLRNYFEHIKN